mmetsp:Transcript_12558/g.26579  ORF Transcript_12558/g.26579 Transcript_12558/m.26579 type:complete len:211 (+) Transcript_12558:562-1194(+)
MLRVLSAQAGSVPTTKYHNTLSSIDSNISRIFRNSINNGISIYNNIRNNISSNNKTPMRLRQIEPLCPMPITTYLDSIRRHHCNTIWSTVMDTTIHGTAWQCHHRNPHSTRPPTTRMDRKSTPSIEDHWVTPAPILPLLLRIPMAGPKTPEKRCSWSSCCRWASTSKKSWTEYATANTIRRRCRPPMRSCSASLRNAKRPKKPAEKTRCG